MVEKEKTIIGEKYYFIEKCVIENMRINSQIKNKHPLLWSSWFVFVICQCKWSIHKTSTMNLPKKHA